MKSRPAISVIMSVYNAERHLEESIKSILDQTFGDFEFIIINDCSTDKSLKIIKKFKDSRILILRNSRNIGLAASLNRAIKLSKGKYIARMDADDISDSKRLETQYLYLEQNKNIGILGTSIEIMNTGQIWNYPKSDKEIKSTILISNPLSHPTVFFRSSIFNDRSNFYNEKFRTSQDYELWSRLFFKSEFANLDLVLLRYRMEKNKLGVFYSDSYQNNLIGIRKKMLEYLVGNVNYSKVKDFNYICINQPESVIDFKSQRNLFLDLIKTNSGKKIFPKWGFKIKLILLYLTAIKKSGKYTSVNLLTEVLRFGWNNLWN